MKLIKAFGKNWIYLLAASINLPWIITDQYWWNISSFSFCIGVFVCAVIRDYYED